MIATAFALAIKNRFVVTRPSKVTLPKMHFVFKHVLVHSLIAGEARKRVKRVLKKWN